MQYFDVIVLGGGAAGMMCALTAGQRGRTVLLLEGSNKVGKKILMSGGGRCNFTNLNVDAQQYISHNPHFCKSALAQYTQWDFIALVERHGIAYHERKYGELFCDHSARDILAMLMDEAQQASVCIETRTAVQSIQPVNVPADARYRYQVRTDRLQAYCHSLVIATGGLSIPTMGASGLGYEIARQFGLPVYATRAGLVPFTFTDSLKSMMQKLSGVSVDSELKNAVRSFSKPVLFTHRGMSGPAALQLSSYWLPGQTIELNMLPEFNACDWLVQSKIEHPKYLLRTLLASQMPKRLVVEWLELHFPEYADIVLADISDARLREVGRLLNTWILKPSGTEGYRTAEVTLGGVDTQALSSKTMQSNAHPGLFFIGEVVDVTGHLGGFNFQWAWSSGYVAGCHV